ncbi:prolipoprotein diacylglyceryl transferase [Amnibacterium kyonggiense]|uniref:Phosphatidylglycerol--prolipoprotein diacylglyceryl transferase n=1 Tax=Amnibacterium kyonggiense TaxID=595671 RepID=A0A4V3EAP6_9MICO|nr:prolipoprotein diacylglyceryl transferase [Amnibacterium kyonggiense]TDS77414.1 prolipoprotein diacylglyceryl transferase [Amnibacterium kyonggiense]
MITASIPSPPASWASFSIGIFTIHSYALCILAGIIVAVVLTSRRLTQRGGQPGVVVDFAIVAVPLALIGARAWHVLTHIGDYFGPAHPLTDITTWGNAIAIWNGGNAIFGAIVGGAVGAWIASRWTGVRFLSFADAVAPGMLFAQGLGRLGNWFNTELYGLPTTLPWGLQVPSDNASFPAGLAPGTLFHPTFLYELIWNFAGAILILVIERRVALRWGRALGLYLIWYGIGRSVFEAIRIDPTTVYFGLRVNIWGAFLAILVGIAVIVWSRRRHPGVEVGVYRPGREWVPDAPVVSRYTAADFVDDPDADQAEVPATSGAPARR